MTDIIDIRTKMKPPRTVVEFMERELADPCVQIAVAKEMEKMRAQQEIPPERL